MSKVNFEELLNNQWEIDKTFEEFRRLNKTHNWFLNYKKNPHIIDKELMSNYGDEFVSESEIMKISMQLAKKYFLTIMLMIFALVILFNTPFIIGILSSIVTYFFYRKNRKAIIKLDKAAKDLKEKKKKFEKKVKGDDNILYEKLCETRSLYHKMNNEQAARVSTLAPDDYLEFMQLLNEYMQVLELIKEKWGQNKEVVEDNENSKITITTVNPVVSLLYK